MNWSGFVLGVIIGAFVAAHYLVIQGASTAGSLPPVVWWAGSLSVDSLSDSERATPMAAIQAFHYGPLQPEMAQSLSDSMFLYRWYGFHCYVMHSFQCLGHIARQ